MARKKHSSGDDGQDLGSPGCAESRLNAPTSEVLSLTAQDSIGAGRTDEVLLQTEQRLALALSGARVGMYDRDTATGETLCTEQAARLLGLRTTTTTTTTTLSRFYHYHDWAERVHPADLPQVEAQLYLCLVGRAPYEVEYRIVWFDGSVRWIADRGVFQEEPDGRPVHMLGILMDITDHRQAQEALEKAHEHLLARAEETVALNEQLLTEREELQRQTLELHRWKDQAEQTTRTMEGLIRLAEENPDPVLLVVLDGAAQHRIQYRNPAAFELCRRWSAGAPRSLPPAVRAIVTEAYDKDEIIRREMPFGEHTYLVTAAPGPAPARYVNLYVRDVTKRKQAEEAMQESQERLAAELEATRRLRELSTQLIRGGDTRELHEQMLDTAMVIMHADFASIQGLEAKDGSPGDSGVLHLLAWKGFHPQSARSWESVHMDSATSCGAALRTGVRVVIADTEQYALAAGTQDLEEYRRSGIRSVQSTPLISRSGRLLGVMSTHWRQPCEPPTEALHLFDVLARQVADLLERRRDEAALREWNATLEAKVAQRTAELRQRAEQLQKMTFEVSQAEDRERKHLAEILHDDLQQIIAGAKFHLSLLRKQVKSDADLHELTLEIDQMLKEAIDKSRSLSHELSPTVLQQGDVTETLRWLADQIQAKHGLAVRVHTEGEVDLYSERTKTFLYKTAQELLFNIVKHARVQEAAVRVRRRGEYVCLLVSDRGRGFDPKELRQAAGFGLLSIRERIELLGGRMKIRSARGRGSVFSIVLPDREEVVSSRTSVVGEEQPRTRVDNRLPATDYRQPLRVLLADDHRIVREGLRSLLKGESDIEIVGEAVHGREAIDLAVQLKPDVVIMDVSMPVIDGDEATRHIKTRLPDTRVIALSTYNEPEVVQKMQRAGAEGYVLKTASTEELLAAIRGSGSPS